MKILSSMVKFSLKTPFNLSYWWNIGSILGVMMLLQIISGLILTLYYESSSDAFFKIWLIHMNMWNGSLFHLLHMNCSSLLFLLLYLHIMKGILFCSFMNYKMLWVSGFIIMVLTMLISFLGYVLPWGQMSLWGATVITNLLSIIPIIGVKLVNWVWGGFFVSNYTLKLFFSMHFILPMLLLVFIVIHLTILHFHGSSNPLGGQLKICTEFSPFYIYKDMMSVIVIFMLITMVLMSPYLFSDPENFIHADPLSSPLHIQPEWYFLNYYCILRAIPSKIGGVLMFIIALLLVLAMTVVTCSNNLNTFKFWWGYSSFFLMNNMGLMWLGSCPVEAPFLGVSKILSTSYFLWFCFLFFMSYSFIFLNFQFNY